MAAVSTDTAIEQLLAVLSEAFDGPKESWSYFTDSGAQAGFFGSLVGVSAGDASRTWGGTTLAAHVRHVEFSVGASAAWIRGDRSSKNWSESWSVSVVDDAAWKRLQQGLRSAYADLCEAIRARGAADVESLGGVVAAVAHCAYHLGAVRQKLAASHRL